MVSWLARTTVKQDVHGSISGPGMTNFLHAIFYLYM